MVIITEIIGSCKLSNNLFTKADGIVESPGMKYKHYAPNNKCILVYSDSNNLLLELIKENIIDNTLIIGSVENKDKFNCKYLSYGSKVNLDEISHNIFSLLREADRYNPDLIIIEGVKKEGLGIAIMNRLIILKNKKNRGSRFFCLISPLLGHHYYELLDLSYN